MSRGISLSIACLAAFFLAGACLTKNAEASVYTYADDFNSRKVFFDSHHDPIIFEGDPLPLPGPEKFLLVYHQQLYFYSNYSGANPPAGGASLAYKLPVRNTTDGVDYCNFGWRFWIAQEGRPAYIRLFSSNNGRDWNLELDGRGAPVHPWTVQYSFIEPTARNKWVKIEGSNVVIDDIIVFIIADQVVGVDQVDWGKIKQLYQ